MPLRLSEGFRAIRSEASIVSTGGVAPGGVASAKSVPQGVPSPAVPPEEIRQELRAFARSFSFLVCTKYPRGTAVPGDVPFGRFTSWFTNLSAAEKPESFGAELSFEAELMYEEKAHTDPTVVISLIAIGVDSDRLPHGPIAVMSAIAELVIPEPVPTAPPVATA